MTTARFFCEHCGNEVRPTAAACPHCGRFFADVRCPRCSSTGTPQEFRLGCPSCGYAGFGLPPDPGAGNDTGIGADRELPDGWEIVTRERAGSRRKASGKSSSRDPFRTQNSRRPNESGAGEQLFLLAAITVLVGLITAVLVFLRT